MGLRQQRWVVALVTFLAAAALSCTTSSAFGQRRIAGAAPGNGRGVGADEIASRLPRAGRERDADRRRLPHRPHRAVVRGRPVSRRMPTARAFADSYGNEVPSSTRHGRRTGRGSSTGTRGAASTKTTRSTAGARGTSRETRGTIGGRTGPPTAGRSCSTPIATGCRWAGS